MFRDVLGAASFVAKVLVVAFGVLLSLELARDALVVVVDLLPMIRENVGARRILETYERGSYNTSLLYDLWSDSGVQAMLRKAVEASESCDRPEVRVGGMIRRWGLV